MTTALNAVRDAGTGSILKALGLVAADAVQVIVDLGAQVLVTADMLIDWTACEVATGDEHYQVILLGSNSATFASGVAHLGEWRFGDASTINTAIGGVAGGVMDIDTPASGQIRCPFRNEREGTVYRYLRLHVNVTGTIASGFNFQANIVPRE